VRGYGVTRRMIAIRLLLPVGMALLGVGLAFAWANMHAYGPGGAWGAVLTVVGFFVATAPAVVLFFGCTRVLFGMASATALFISISMADDAVAQHALTERGRIDECTVQDVDERPVDVDLGGTSPSWPGPPTTWSGFTTASTEYVYQLRRPPGGPASMVTDSPVADKGAVILVSWDPSGRLTPRPAGQVGDATSSTRVALALGGVGLLLALLDALIDVRRYPRSPDWIKMPYFHELAERWG
jgi:hypothetical protein